MGEVIVYFSFPLTGEFYGKDGSLSLLAFHMNKSAVSFHNLV
jgi:hypothetical protein